MDSSVPKRSSPLTSQSPPPRDDNNQNNSGVIGNGSGNIVNSGNNNNIIIAKAEKEDTELNRLFNGSISNDALHDTFHAPPECHPGTRKTVLKEFDEWLDNSSPEKSPFLWLHGPAGVGKSVIARTIAGSRRQLVVATFFFSTSSNRDGTTLVPTLAWQLAQKIPATKQHIIASFENNGSPLTSDIKKQFDHLIAQPLKELLKECTFAPLPVMVIDGIDECTDDHALSKFLQVLICAAESGDVPLRFIISSRPEPRIRAMLKKRNGRQEDQEIEYQPSASHPLQRWLHIYWPPRIWIQLPDIRTRLYIPIISLISDFRNPTLLLQDVWNLYRPISESLSASGDTGGPLPDISGDLLDKISRHPLISEIPIGFSKESKKDIAKYLTDKFGEMGNQLGERDISQLVERSCGQFLYASTIVRLLNDFDPKEVVEMARNSCLPTPDLNKLYRVILTRAKDAIQKCDQEGGPDCARDLTILNDTLAILVVLAENVHFFDVRENFLAIESIIGTEKKGVLYTKLRNMHSVLNIDSGVFIRVHHRSFLEFLLSRKRSEEHRIAYPKALRRFLFLLNRAGLKYFVMDWCGKLLDSDRKACEDIVNLALACRRNYFKRSSRQATLTTLHDLIHCALPFICLAPFYQPIRQLTESFIGAPISSSAFAFTLKYLFLVLFCLLILSAASFIISLTIYTLLFNRSLIFPLFHPFLHLHFVTVAGVLLSSRQASSLERTITQANNGISRGTERVHIDPEFHSDKSTARAAKKGLIFHIKSAPITNIGHQTI